MAERTVLLDATEATRRSLYLYVVTCLLLVRSHGVWSCKTPLNHRFCGKHRPGVRAQRPSSVPALSGPRSRERRATGGKGQPGRGRARRGILAVPPSLCLDLSVPTLSRPTPPLLLIGVPHRLKAIRDLRQNRGRIFRTVFEGRT